MPQVKSVESANVAGKRILMRVDFNVPLEMHAGHAVVLADFRIRAVLPTLELLHARGAAKIIILTHLGRPEGKVVDGLRLAPVEARLRELTTVPFEMLENLRFDPREEANDPGFAQELATLGDIFVNEAFPVSHRADVSIVGIPKFLPGYAGLRFEEEVARLSTALTPPSGSVAIIGGAKFETKEPMLKKLLGTYASVLLGGALGNDVIKARGLPVGASLISSTPVPIELAGDVRIELASDAVLSLEGASRVGLVVDTRAGEKIVDVGPATAAAWAAKIAVAPFVLWNGPLGVYEDGFTQGTETIAQALALRSVSGQSPQFHAVIGGGDTVAALAKFDFDKEKVFLSTGGGAMLEFLVAGTLPGIEALKN